MTRFEDREADWLSAEEAVQRVVDAARPLPPERVPLAESLNRALAEPLTARATLPPWDNSAMDGYAARSADLSRASNRSPVTLRVVGEVHAGSEADVTVGPGQAVRIMTGAPVPRGADSVVRVEHTDAEAGQPGWIVVRRGSDAGRNVRPGGQDMTEGEEVLTPGTTMAPGPIGVAAALGRFEVAVHRRPRVAVLSNGDELRGPGRFDDVVQGRGIPETNGPTLAAAVREMGGEAIELGIARDDPDDIRKRVGDALAADVLVTSGGASMGEADLLKRVLEDMGLEVDFWRVRIRPGSPFSLARLPRKDGDSLPVLGLPGNPASAFVTFEVFVRPFLRRLAGHRRVRRRTIRAVAGEPLRSTRRLTHFHRVTLDEGRYPPVARLAGHQNSGLVRSLALADGLAVVREGGGVPEGGPVNVILLGDGIHAAAPQPPETELLGS